jgi:hypothetical protein
MRKHTDYVLDREGNAVVGAEVYVRRQADNVLASLFSDDGSTATANPTITDSDGEFSFWVTDGTYKLQVYIDGVQEQEITNWQHFDLDGITAFGFSLIDDANAAAARTTLGITDAATLEVASTAQVRANTADKLLATDETWAAGDYVALTPGANVAVDLSTGLNFSLAMGGNYTLDNPTNTKNGQAGEIIITQDGTGSRTLAYGSNWKFVGGSDPVLSTAAGAVDVFSYKVVSSTFIIAALSKAFA